jgi:hypothetical protein
MARTISKGSRISKKGKKQPPRRGKDGKKDLDQTAKPDPDDFDMDSEEIDRLLDDPDPNLDVDAFDYEDDLSIDEDAYDDEWLAQSSLMFKYGRAAAILKKRMADIHEDLKVARSEIVKEFKESNKKVTGVEIEAHYRTHPRHVKLKKKFINAEFEVNLIEAAISSLHQKKAALQDLVRMALGELYGDPKSVTLPDGAKFSDVARKKSARKKIKGQLGKNHKQRRSTNGKEN